MAGLRNRVIAAAREPLVHFLLLGAAIYVVSGLASPDVDEAPGNEIVVSAGVIEWLTSTWEKRWNRPPTPEERSGLIAEYIRESVLYREALAMGLDRDDTIIRRRLAQKLEFLSQDLLASQPPTEEALRAYFAAHAARYREPALLTLTQVFVDPDLRGERARSDAEAIKAQLGDGPPPIAGAERLGDPFLLQRYYPQRSEAALAKLFGREFARSVVALERGRWHGPVLSGYGLHLVYVHDRIEAREASYAAVRDRVTEDWEDERRRELNDAFYASLRARYEVIVEDESAADDFAALEEEPR
jgi:hypothetical protein